MIEMWGILIGSDQESEPLIGSPRFDKTVIPHAKCIWVNIDILEWDRVRYHLSSVLTLMLQLTQ